MKSKKIFVIGIIVLIFIIAILAGVLILKPFEDEEKKDTTEAKNDVSNVKSKEDKIDYEEILDEFAHACNDEEDMNDFIDKYFDFKSCWAAHEAPDFSEYEDIYKNAKKSDYEDEDFIEEIKELYQSYIFDDKVEISNVEDKNFVDIGTEEWNFVNFELNGDEIEEEMTAIFSKDKIVIIAPKNEVDMVYEVVSNNDSSEKKDNKEKNLDTATVESALRVALAEIASDYYSSNKSGDLVDELTTESIGDALEESLGEDYSGVSIGTNDIDDMISIVIYYKDYTFEAKVTDKLSLEEIELLDDEF